ncbi:MAG: polysaccharide deacetylase family protein [Acidobacteria bacterium]|nr:polysaccharide deacetylase family protein [Acidobacteriota bacterium]
MTERTANASDALGRMRAAAAPAAKRAFMHMGGFAAVRRVLPSHQLAILRYHAVCGPEGHRYADPSICVTPLAFERHIAYLTRAYTVLRLEDAVRSLANGERLPANAVAITFDDGYADNLGAARTLARYGASATFYITAGCMAGGQPFWPVELRALVRAVSEHRVRLAVDSVHVDLNLDSDAGRTAAVRLLTRTFKSHPIPVREALREQLRRLAPATSPDRVMLTWDEIREMHALGMTIGSHTMTHPNLPSAGLVAAREELVASRDHLERQINAPVTMFSYPNGGAERYLTRDVQLAVRDAGYLAATTSRNAFAGAHSDLYGLERIQVRERLEELIFALEVERFAFRPQPRVGEAG